MRSHTRLMARGEEREGNQNKSEIRIILVFIEPDSVPGPVLSILLVLTH